jgi:hypothetical protein
VLGEAERSFYYGNLSYLPTLSRSYWEISFDRIEVGGVPLPVCQLGLCRAAIDSGTSLVTNPNPSPSPNPSPNPNANPKP